MITAEHLIKIGVSKTLAMRFVDHINNAMSTYEINTPLRKQHFLAQILHESGHLQYVREIANGEAYDTGRLAAALGNTPADDDDGRRYKGRGLIQITGTSNYKALGADLREDFFSKPELLETPKYAAMSAGWYWNKRKLNASADVDDLMTITKKINGGYNGLAERTAILRKAKAVIR